MSSKEIAPINAGSMADIAFLLLIFFLVTTTMDVDQGLMKRLAPIDDDHAPPTEISEAMVFKIDLNADEMLIEGQEAHLNDLSEKLKGFLTNGGVFEDVRPLIGHVSRRWISEVTEVSTSSLVSSTPSVEAWREKRNNAISEARALFGPYKAQPSKATILLQYSSDVDYDRYLSVHDAVDATVHELRDELVSRYRDSSFLDLDQRDPDDRRLIKAVSEIYPLRVSEIDVSSR